MNIFGLIFWVCVIVDCIVPGVNIALGWYFLWGALAIINS